MAKAVLTFALYQGDALQRREQVTQDIVKVGKDPKSHLRVACRASGPSVVGSATDRFITTRS